MSKARVNIRYYEDGAEMYVHKNGIYTPSDGHRIITEYVNELMDRRMKRVEEEEYARERGRIRAWADMGKERKGDLPCLCTRNPSPQPACTTPQTPPQPPPASA